MVDTVNISTSRRQGRRRDAVSAACLPLAEKPGIHASRHSSISEAEGQASGH